MEGQGESFRLHEGEDTIRENERMKIGVPLKNPKKPSKESIMESATVITEEMVTIATLKEAIANYFLIDDIYEYEDNPFVLILGRLEMGLITRKQLLDVDRKVLLEL